MFSLHEYLHLLLLFVKLCYSQTEFTSSDVHSDIVCCECVSFYLCVNGTINTDGGGIIDVRIGGQTTPPPVVNVKVCPGPVDICCEVPDIDPSCSAQPTSPIKIVAPHPESNCECTGYNSCDPSLVVSDGLGLTSVVLTNGRMVNHSKCIHSLDVCCYIPDILTELGEATTPTSPLISGTDGECECVPPFLCGPDGHIKTDGAGILDVRIRTPKPPIKCPFDPELVCCLPPKPEVIESTTVAIPLTSSLAPITDGKCECVAPSLCDADGHIKTHAEGILNARIGPPKPPTPCPFDPELVCCLPPKSAEVESTTITIPASSSLVPILDKNCECVPPILCGVDGHIKTDGADIIEVRFGPTTPPIPCPIDPNMVCCLPPKSVVQETTSVLPPVTAEPRVPYKPPCGQRNINGIGVRILGFKEGQTQFGEFPWVAMLLKKSFLQDKEINVFVGGGSLIHRRVVMTAAHKVEKVPVNELVVRLGEYDTASSKESISHQEIGVEQVIIHEKFFPSTLFHDIALLVLKENANEDFHIAEICPASSLDDVVASSCVTNGWGVDAFKSGNNQKIMKSVPLPMVDKPMCQNMLRRTRLGRFFSLHESFMCAGGEEGVDACEGDGGGPLSCQRLDDPSRFLQVGITAWGIGCGGKDVPGVYVDVPYHYQWIMDHINSVFPKQIDAHPPTTIPTDQRELTREERRELRKQERKAERERKRQQRRRQQRRRNRRNRRIEGDSA